MVDDPFPVVLPSGYVLKRKWTVCSRGGCPVCASVLDACHDAALLAEALSKISPDSTVPPLADVLAAEEVGFSLA